MDFFRDLLVNALTPITLISGVGLLMLCMVIRYNHSTDRIRQLIKKREDGGWRDEPDIDREIRLIYRRARYLRLAMLSLTLSDVFSGLLVATNVFANFSGINLVTVSALWLVCALVLIVVSTGYFSAEVSVSLHALDMAVEHMPNRREPRSCA